MTNSAEVIAASLQVPEGPALRPDSSIVFTEQTAGLVSLLNVYGSVDDFAYVGGAPNSCTVGAAGEIYVCQNGGVVGAWRSNDPRTPGIQRIRNNRVEQVASHIDGHELRAPNDLAFAPDGALCFTDPAQPFDPDDRRNAGYLYALGARTSRLLDLGGVYCNGIGFAPAGEMLWVESYTRRVRRLREGLVQTLCTLPEGHIPDGFAVADDGRIFVASCGSHGIDVVGPDGEYEGFLELDEMANPTNCCFRENTLVVTDFGIDFERDPKAGRLWAVPVDATGGPVWTGTVQMD